MAIPTLNCETHGQPTRISCVDCNRPICPKCLVRTEVGTKCESCASPTAARVTSPARPGRRILAIGVAVALVLAVVVALLLKGGGSSAIKPAAPPVGRWAPQASLSAIRGTTSVVTLKNGQVLAAGGGVGQIPVVSSELYDPTTAKWTMTGPLNVARRGASAVLLSTGQVLITGGVSGASILSSSELYDPSSGRWTLTGAMTAPRLDNTLTLLENGDVLAAGGTTTVGTPGTGAGQTIIPTASAELYDPSSGRWSSTASMTASRFEATATSLADGRVLIAGGLGGPGVAASTGLQYPPLTSAEIYDPAVKAFTNAGRMAAGRADQVAARLADGSVIVVGGSGGSNGLVALSSTERFAPSTGAWTTVASPAVARTGAAATVLADGSVLVAGGQAIDQGSSSSLATAELYEPAQATWRSAGKMSCPRSGLAAANLADGSALEVAGDTAFPGQPPVAQGCVDRYYPDSSRH